jgi:hypothetical protein
MKENVADIKQQVTSLAYKVERMSESFRSSTFSAPKQEAAKIEDNLKPETRKRKPYTKNKTAKAPAKSP